MTGLVCPHCDSAFDSDKRLARADVAECKLCQQKFVVTQSTLTAYKKVQQAKQKTSTTLLLPSAPVKIICPHCASGLQGDIALGQIVECPDCHKQFEATPERLNNTIPVLAKTAASPSTAANHKPKSKVGLLALIFLGLVFLFPLVAPDSSDNKASSNEKAATVSAPVIRDTNAPENFLSGWDGSNRELVRLVKSGMNDPDSFEHVETRFTDNGDSLSLLMTFRGKNGFNATVTNKVSADLDKTTRQLSNIKDR